MSKDQLVRFSELAGKQVEVPDLMTYVIKYMMDKGLKLDNTEGMIEAAVFPVNYFTIKQVISRVMLPARAHGRAGAMSLHGTHADRIGFLSQGYGG